MATKFLDPGGDATFGFPFFDTTSATPPTVATDFVHTPHIKSVGFTATNRKFLGHASSGSLADAGSRISFYVYLVALPTATATIFRGMSSALGSVIFSIRLTTGGVLQIFDAETSQIGSNGGTLATGKWYRISLAYTITSTTVNRFEAFINGISSISITNATITATGTSTFEWGNCEVSGDATLDFRGSDFYIDNSNALTDPGNIWVTAKRPFSNGTTNNFVTQIGAGGSSYGTGHSPQVNERANSDSNGWSVVAVGVTVEEYNIENPATGDMSIMPNSIVDYMGWVRAKTLSAETASMILNNVTSNVSLTTSITTFKAFAGSTTYPAGTGTDIGLQTTALATTVSLYECGIVFAFIPKPGNFLGTFM